MEKYFQPKGIPGAAKIRKSIKLHFNSNPKNEFLGKYL